MKEYIINAQNSFSLVTPSDPIGRELEIGLLANPIMFRQNVKFGPPTTNPILSRTCKTWNKYLFLSQTRVQSYTPPTLTPRSQTRISKDS